MILRRFLLTAVLLCGAPYSSSCFQQTQAHFPTPYTIQRQFDNQQQQRRKQDTFLEATSVIPPPSLSGRQSRPLIDRPALVYQEKQEQHNNLNLFRPKSSNANAKRKELWLDESAYQRRKEEWASKYTSVDALRYTFGASRNGVWGDLDAQTARRLYKTLLPKALLELYKMGVHPEDLAPLAYRARVAAKLYARERCSLPFRAAANFYDGFRQWRRYGSFDTHGMSFQQIWEKYSAVILEEPSSEDLTEEDVTARICLKILERSCATNEMVDNLVLRDEESKQDLEKFTQTLEQDVRRLLQPINHVVQPRTERDLQRIRTLRRVARIKKRLSRSSKPSSSSSEDSASETSVPRRAVFPWQNRAPRAI